MNVTGAELREPSKKRDHYGDQMKTAIHNRKDLLEKGYIKSQCVLLRLGGMYVKRNEYEWLNKLYVVFFLGIFGTFIFILIPYSISIALPMGEMFVTFQDLHYWLVMFGYSGTSVMYHMNREAIDNALVIIGNGFYTYEGDEEDEDAKRIVVKNKMYLKKLTKFMVPNGMAVGAFVIMVPPILELITYGGKIKEDAVLNPYLPLPLFTMWDQFTISGYLGVYLLMFAATVFVVLELLALSLGYSSFMVLYITQFTLLNNSIVKMEERATKRFLQISKQNLVGLKKFKDPVFQKCMHYCIKQNIQHHQILLRWIKEAQKFLGWALLCTFLATSILLATTGYLFTMRNDSILALVILIQVQFLELVHSYLFCRWGEALATESAKIPISLYSLPWFDCDKKFNRILHIMLANTLNPVVPRDPVLKLKASLEIYGSMISSAYTYFNVIRSAN